MLTVSERLDQAIFDDGISLEYHPHLCAIDGVYINDSRLPRPVIAIRQEIRSTFHENVVKAHEYGHHHSGIIDPVSPEYVRVSREEAAAIRNALDYLMPVSKLIECYEKGICTPFEITDHLEITMESFCRGIKLYYSKYGPCSIHGQYVINWNPFSIKRDRRRKR